MHNYEFTERAEWNPNLVADRLSVADTQLHPQFYLLPQGFELENNNKNK